jgi:hypothetical protein
MILKKLALRLEAEERLMMAQVRAGYTTSATLAEALGMDARQIRRIGARLLEQMLVRRDWVTAGRNGSRVMHYALPDAPKPPPKPKKARPPKKEKTYTKSESPVTPMQRALRRLHKEPGLTARELGLDPADVAPLLARGVVERHGDGLKVTKDGALCL